jgi:hypothetical protein
MLQELLDYMRSKPGVWITSGREIARHVVTSAAAAGTDGRPLPDPVPSAAKGRARQSGKRARSRR